MKWHKKGLIYHPTGKVPWAIHSACVPTVLALDASTLRIFVGFRDEEGSGRIGFVDVSPGEPSRILRVSQRPVLDLGDPGTFDDSGVLPVSIVQDSGLIYMYYAGFQRGVKIDFHHLAGVAVSSDGGENFQRVKRVPVLERTDRELFLRSAPHVLKQGDTWKMWYVGFDGWLGSGAKAIYRSRINYLESASPIDWGSKPESCIVPGSDDEFGFGRPFVYRDAQTYKMFYSVRTESKGYRLGYAESPDGVTWIRLDDQVGIGVSEDGWDASDICWCALVRQGNTTMMFYNGNSYGRTGFGYAVLADSAATT
jgi:predicted GH43/DUF377 family glycosyl hydrolase